MKIDSDIDIDLSAASREKLLNLIEHTSASMRNVVPIRKHSTGVYINPVPYDPVTDMCNVDYKSMEERGYFKLDLLNVHVYEQVKDERHLIQLMDTPDWTMLKDKPTVEKLIHLNTQYYNLQRMPEPVNSIQRLAMFLAIIRPGKKHLIGKKWQEISKTVWDKTQDGYSFKQAHGVAYAHLVVVHMNLLAKNIK
jgi:hypothetical protein